MNRLPGWRGARAIVLLVSWLCALPGISAAWAQAGAAPGEYQVKAAYVFKFLNYVDWPPEQTPEAPLRIGVIGARALADELSAIAASRTVNGRAVQVRRLRAGETTTDLNVLFVARSEDARLADIVASIKDRATLVVTESAEAPAFGSAINFVVVDDKVRFDVAPQAFERAHLKVSARLLTVARKVLAGPS